MQKIIVLAADEDKGKTTTLNYLIDMLYCAAEESEIYHNCDTDSWSWFKINGQWVFVGTAGDEAKIVKENINYTKDYDCVIGIIASHENDRTAQEVLKHVSKDGSPVKMIYKKDLEKELKEIKDYNNNAKNRLIAAKFFQEIFNALVPELANKQLIK